MIRDGYDQISFLIPQVDMAASLAIDLKAQVLQSLDGFLAETTGSLGKSLDLYVKE